jgi:hypothetical protein
VAGEVLRSLSSTLRGRIGIATLLALLLVAGVFAMTRPDAAAPRPEPEPVPAAVLDAEHENAPAQPPEVAAPAAAPAPAAVPGQQYTPVRATQAMPPMAKPRAVRGIYLNAWSAGSARKLTRLIELARATEVNAFVIDVKEVGELSYPSAVPLARQIGANRRYIADIQGVLARLRAEGIYPIARIVAFRDPILAEARPDLAIVREDGSLWQDRDGFRWVDSFNREVWDYNIAIAREAIELGFAEVQWDYVRFPDVPQALMRTAIWPAQAGRTKQDGIREFLRYSREQLADLNVPVTADVFGLTVSVRNDMGIGQLWEKMVDATDVLLPMVYPSHFARGSYGIPQPNANPYEIVRRAMEYAVRRTPQEPGMATVRPWLQDFTLGQPRYGAEEVRAQIEAVYDAGLTEWILWNPSSNYTAAALGSPDGTPPAVIVRRGVLPDTTEVEPEPDTARVLGQPVDP